MSQGGWFAETDTSEYKGCVTNSTGAHFIQDSAVFTSSTATTTKIPIFAGAATVSSLDAGSGAIQTTGTLASGAATVSSLDAGSGTIETTGTVSGATLTGTLSTAAQSNITSVGTLTSLGVTGAITAGSLDAGSGTIETSGTVSGATLTGTLSTAAQSNITSVGTLTSLGVTGAITAGSLDAGSGTIETSGNIKATGSVEATSFMVGADHIIQAYTGSATDRALLLGFGGNTDRIGIGEASSGHATLGVYDHSNHTKPNAVIIENAKLGIGTGFTNGIPNALTEALEVVGNVKATGYYIGNEGFAKNSQGHLTFNTNIVTGGVELAGTLDFKDNSESPPEDYDARVTLSANGLNFVTGGNGSTALGMTLDSTQNLHITENITGNGDIYCIGTRDGTTLKSTQNINVGTVYDGVRYGAIQAAEATTVVNGIPVGVGIGLSSWVLNANRAVVAGYQAGTTNWGIFNWGTNGVGVYLTNGGNTWQTQSDERSKILHGELTNVLANVDSLRCVYYNYDNGETTEHVDTMGNTVPPLGRRIGFVAQDWLPHYPEVIDGSEDKTYSMAYTETIPILLQAIKELKARIEALENA